MVKTCLDCRRKQSLSKINHGRIVGISSHSCMSSLRILGQSDEVRLFPFGVMTGTRTVITQ